MNIILCFKTRVLQLEKVIGTSGHQDDSPASHSKSKHQEIVFEGKDYDFKFAMHRGLQKHLMIHTGVMKLTINARNVVISVIWKVS